MGFEPIVFGVKARDVKPLTLTPQDFGGVPGPLNYNRPTTGRLAGFEPTSSTISQQRLVAKDI